MTNGRTGSAWLRHYPLLVLTVGIVGVFVGLTDSGKPYSVLRLIAFVLGEALVGTAGLLIERGSPDRVPVFVGIFGLAFATVTIAEHLAKTQLGLPGRYVIAGSAFAVLLAPAFAFLSMWRSMQDELQKSVVSASALISLVVLITASLGYWILERAVRLPAIPSVWFAVAGAGLWLAIWVVMRRRIA